MSKIMLVEDDNNLRDIYAARLQAEGYDTVSAQDGEEALALAVKEMPDLIISDVMMPKISGFDMLDILRTTPETKNTKVIMMTALSQAEDKARADQLGADRYLVKSQVTLEDVVRTVYDVLNSPSKTVTDASSVATVSNPAPTIIKSDPDLTTQSATPTPTPSNPTQQHEDASGTVLEPAASTSVPFATSTTPDSSTPPPAVAVVQPQQTQPLPQAPAPTIQATTMPPTATKQQLPPQNEQQNSLNQDGINPDDIAL